MNGPARAPNDPLRPAEPAPPLEGWALEDGEVLHLEHEAGQGYAIDCGHDVWLSLDERPRWFHRCGVLRHDGHRVAWVFYGSGLAPGHVVTRDAAGRVTIRASILCLRCGAHGWITDSKWEPA